MMKPDALHLSLQTTTANACGGMGGWAKEAGDSVQHVVTPRTRAWWVEFDRSCQQTVLVASGLAGGVRRLHECQLVFPGHPASPCTCLTKDITAPKYFANFNLPARWRRMSAAAAAELTAE